MNMLILWYKTLSIFKKNRFTFYYSLNVVKKISIGILRKQYFSLFGTTVAKNFGLARGG